ncbi:MAG TPA: cyclic nucleotide-binding domain-containing protein [Haliangiales bacterium]|nr:cyclic nucleotide-binding domain-containing protein [Haliangiales bacterium]
MAPKVIPLRRGGAIVETSIGAVQFGAPPETLKDALNAGLEVPSIFVLPRVWFSRRRGTSLAELEFPTYYNYFVCGRRVTVVCDADARRRLRTVLREALFGPEYWDPALDYDPSVPPGARADLLREAEWFRRIEGDPRRHIRLDDVLEVVLYDDAGVARLGGVEIRRDERGWSVSDGGAAVEVAEEDTIQPNGDAPPPPAAAFAPPAFGVTVLGSSHGFDPAGKTTGFVLWVNRRGILIDPPTDSTELLRAAGVSPRHVDAVILTHCHADHDAGVLQKILEDERVDVYTTPTILGSFVRKWTALTGEPEDRLRRLFQFRPVAVGGPLRIHGAQFRFFYALHSIPTVGFECFFGGKSFAYSSDTLFDPARIESMHREGILGRERRDALLDFPFYHSLVIHEAGVPPIHTPAAQLADLPEETRARLRVIHIAEADLPPGLRHAHVGFDETLILPVAEPPYAEALSALDALASVDLFRDFTVEKCREFLTIARPETHPAGALVIGQGERGDKFYIIQAGEASVAKDGVLIATYREGDFFGETALVTGAPRSADVRAKTALVLLAVEKHDFLSFLRGTDLVPALGRLARNRDLPSWELMGENGVLRGLGAKQRTRLQASLEHRELAEGQVLWEVGAPPDGAWLLDDAEVVLDGRRVGRAAFLADADGLLRNRPARSRVVVARSGGAFRVSSRDLAEILEEAPALMLALSGVELVR